MFYLSKKDSGVMPPEKKAAKPQPPVKQGLFKKGFLNPRPTASITPISPREVIDVGVVGSSSPPRDCIIPSSVEENGFSQFRAWSLDFDHKGEIVVWEEDVDFWDGLPLDWAMDDDFGEEALAIRDAMEEDFLQDKMIAR